MVIFALVSHTLTLRILQFPHPDRDLVWALRFLGFFAGAGIEEVLAGAIAVRSTSVDEHKMLAQPAGAQGTVGVPDLQPQISSVTLSALMNVSRTDTVEYEYQGSRERFKSWRHRNSGW